jgi:hypothetical protein
MLSGEMKLENQKERTEKLKVKAAEKQRDSVRKMITSGDAQVETEGVDKKVVQNLKLFEWTAPVRIKYIFDFRTFLIIVSVILLFILYLAILGHYTFMGVMIALVFFIYVAGATEPILSTHRITARGVESFEKLYEWFMLGEFYFTVKDGHNMLIIETKLRFPTKLIMLLDVKERQPLFVLLQDKLLYKDLRNRNFIEKATFGEYVALEKV